MPEEKLEYTKMRERTDWAISFIKEKAKENNVPFDKDLLTQACEMGRCMFVRSEIAYSGKH